MVRGGHHRDGPLGRAPATHRLGVVHRRQGADGDRRNSAAGHGSGLLHTGLSGGLRWSGAIARHQQRHCGQSTPRIVPRAGTDGGRRRDADLARSGLGSGVAGRPTAVVCHGRATGFVPGGQSLRGASGQRRDSDFAPGRRGFRGCGGAFGAFRRCPDHSGPVRRDGASGQRYPCYFGHHRSGGCCGRFPDHPCRGCSGFRSGSRAGPLGGGIGGRFRSPMVGPTAAGRGATPGVTEPQPSAASGDA